MIDIDGKIASFDVFTEHFVCDLDKCKGQCCVDGDAGAPLEVSEIAELEKIFPIVKNYMCKEGVEAIQQKGVYEIDADGDHVTPLVNNNECAFVIFENQIAKCAIEKAFLEGKIAFKKPISCHLYPIRITSYDTFEAINYHRWHVCKPAEQLGKKLNVSVCKFLKEPLIRKYGKKWYKQFSAAEDHVKKTFGEQQMD